MKHYTFRAVAALAFAALAGLAALARPDEVRPAARSTAPIRAKTILGSKVTLSGGAAGGTVEDIVLTDEGVVDYLIVTDDGGKLRTVPWDAVKFDYRKRTAAVNVTEEQYRKVPAYSAERYPDFYAPTYRTDVYKYYNLRPGQQRRLERRLERQERRDERRP